MLLKTNGFVGAAVAAALFITPTSSGAASAASHEQEAQSAQAGWLALSMLTPGGAIGLGGAAGQPAQTPGDYAPPPQARGGIPTPPIPVIAVWLATVAVAVYILTRDHHGRFQFPQPNSAG